MSQQTPAATADDRPAAAPPRVPAFVGAAAEVLLAALVLGAGAGIVWGFLRPSQEVTFLEAGRLGVMHPGLDATFTALLWFTLVALVSGLVLGVLAYRRHQAYRGLAMEAWAGVAAMAMAGLQLATGNFVGAARQPDYSGAEVGQTFDIVPAFNTPVAILVAPFAAMLVYWSLLLVLGDATGNGKNGGESEASATRGNDAAGAATGEAPRTAASPGTGAPAGDTPRDGSGGPSADGADDVAIRPTD